MPARSRARAARIGHSTSPSIPQSWLVPASDCTTWHSIATADHEPRRDRTRACHTESMTKFLTVVALTSVLAIPQAQTPGGTRVVPNVDIYGPGSMSCGGWTDALPKKGDERHFAQMIWVLGWVSAAGDYLPGTMAETDSDGIEAAMTVYCAANPLDPIVKAARVVVTRLYTPPIVNRRPK